MGLISAGGKRLAPPTICNAQIRHLEIILIPRQPLLLHRRIGHVTQSRHLIKTLDHIILGCKKQDRASQHELYKTYYSYGMSIAIRYVLQEQEAITILNDSFLKVFDKINAFDESLDIKPWLRKIIVNTALDHLKATKRLKMEVDINDQYDLSAPEHILSKIGYDELMLMIKQLSHAYRTVFNLYAIDGFKHEEIAKKLNITVGTSKSNLSKARKALQGMITQQMTVHHG